MLLTNIRYFYRQSFSGTGAGDTGVLGFGVGAPLSALYTEYKETITKEIPGFKSIVNFGVNFDTPRYATCE